MLPPARAIKTASKLNKFTRDVGIRNRDMSTVRLGIHGLMWTADAVEAPASGEGHGNKG
jgi:hypothetical protein